MATYNSLQSRAKSSANIPEDFASEIFKAATKKSAAMQLFRRMPVATSQKRFPVMSALPVAYFVSPTDTGLKQTTDASWESKYIDIEEIAAIVPIPESVFEDLASGGFDLMGEIMPLLAEAIGRKLDAAIFFGTDAPTSWPDDLSTAIAAVHAARIANDPLTGIIGIRGTHSPANGGILSDLDIVLAGVEAMGYDPSAIVTDTSFKKYLRRARDTTGQKLFDSNTNEFEGAPIGYTMDGLWPSGASAEELFYLDRSKFILGLRKDITFTVHRDGVISDGNGAIVYNLMQQDMFAIRVVCRVGWQVANPVNHRESEEDRRYPASLLLSPAS